MTESYSRLAHVALTYPIIDNHCHNLLTAASRDHLALERLTSENDGAQGDGLADARFTIAHMRAVRQLVQLYGCLPNWEAVKEARAALDYDELCRRCFEGQNIFALLIDNGLGDVAEHCEPVSRHAQWTTGGVARIVLRVESIAEEILGDMFKQQRSELPKLHDLIHGLDTVLSARAKDPNVVAFKSVICYRTGLDLEMNLVRCGDGVGNYIAGLHKKFGETGTVRIAHPGLNSLIVHTALLIASKFNKPVQFHTGLGDRDLRLVLANPALLQPVIERYSQTQFVLLHASYPYTREAGYLASVYGNVFLDIGEIWPIASADAQRTAVRNAFDLCPTNKILFSTDAHHWPDGYYLGVQQGRAAFLSVLTDYVTREDLTEDQAIEIVQRAYFHNSNELYRLGLSRPET